MSHDQRQAAVDHLSTLLRDDRIDIDTFEAMVAHVLATTTPDELAVVLAPLPSPVRMTPPELRLAEPLVIDARSGSIKLTSSWQLAARTEVRCRSGAVVLDLTAAEFDDEIIELDLDCWSGSINVIVPPGIGVRMTEISGSSGVVKNDTTIATSLPGMPCLLVSARTRSGTIRIRPPKAPRRWRWFGWFRGGTR